MQGIAGARRAYAVLRVIEKACRAGIDVAPEFDGAERVRAAAVFIAQAFPCTWANAWRNRSRSLNEIWSAASQCASQGESLEQFLMTFCNSVVGSGMRHADARRAPLIFVGAVLHWQLLQVAARSLDAACWQYIGNVIADASGEEAQDTFLKHDRVDQALRERLGDRYRRLDMESKIRCHAAIDVMAVRSRVSRTSVVLGVDRQPRSSSELEELVKAGVLRGRACSSRDALNNEV